MVNLAEIINEVSTIAALDLYYETHHVQRRRLGISQIGHKCRRYLWYKHHGYDESAIPGRVLRLFQLGNIIEDHIAEDLAKAGVIVGKRQYPVEFTLGGITLSGSIDGVVEGLIESSKPHVWECKTVGSKYWSKLKKNGYEQYNEQYKAQIHAYMLGTGLKRAFVTAYNKDTSELYQERIKLNREWIVDKLADVFNVICQESIPERECPRADWYEAKWCCFYGECFK